ncbi:FAD-dependent pyridine nucleotide-disulfide oxidoreductase [Natrialba chahannaoensis JCM 10990]|uniref:FAD-dependent pyridine nucleotide-disulfide oxidoreductase n=1 Tax=Natrialba chahannaoensis JCM 10990 TaxID=1227492 RepID=M0AER5_9EURY|nr:NAD(P)/FAD-dependent oxidoreductase [Natrialba chahannaoensis]ELY97245.1 FAD-dependent pyridine nucleotide-disulfide oxidoreductase [Natrialba chahannaoensis JCM 10990]
MTKENTSTTFDVVVVGGGPAGLSAALYCTRLGNTTALIDRGGGRAAMMQDVHNVVGISEETSGAELLSTGKEQLEAYGCTVFRDTISSCSRREQDTRESTKQGSDGSGPDTEDSPSQITLCGTDTDYVADYVVLATGFTDERPDPPLPRTGRGLHYCLHCDAYMFIDEPVYVMGTSESAAYVAAIMLNFTSDVDLLTRNTEPTWSDDTETMLSNHPIEIVHEEIASVQNGDDGWLESLTFEDGTVREYTGGFAMYGSDYNNGLAAELGCALNDDGTVIVDDHGQTSVENVYAVGDLTPGHNQVPIALGEGARAGISIHWNRREFPRDPTLIDELGPVRNQDVPGIPDELLERAVEHHTYN